MISVRLELHNKAAIVSYQCLTMASIVSPAIDVKNHLLSRGVDGQITRDRELAITHLLYSPGFELHRRIVGGIEKIGGLSLRVMLADSRVHGRAIDGGLHCVPARDRWDCRLRIP